MSNGWHDAKSDVARINKLLNDMCNSLNLDRENSKQIVEYRENSNEYKVEFVRDGRALMFGFYGFGDLMGYYARATSAKYTLAENRIGADDHVTLYLSNPEEKYIRIFINSDIEPSKHY